MTNGADRFLQSSLATVGEMFGYEPNPEIRYWRERNPTASIGSQVVGYAVPYTGWFRAAKAGQAAAAAGRGGNIVSRTVQPFHKALGADRAAPGFVRGMKRDLAIFAPFELGRAGISTAVATEGSPFGLGFESTGLVSAPSKPFGEAVSEAAFTGAVELGFSGALGGIGGAIASGVAARRLAGAKKDPLKNIGITNETSPTVAHRKIEDYIATSQNIDPALMTQLRGYQNTYKGRILTDIKKQKQGAAALNRDVVEFASDPQQTNAIWTDNFFKLGDDPTFGRTHFIVPPSQGGAHGVDLRHFGGDINNLYREFGLDGDWITRIERPRLTVSKGTGSSLAADADRRIVVQGLNNHGFTAVSGSGTGPTDSGWFLQREATEGLYVMARSKVIGDRAMTLMLKTHDPGAYVPHIRNFSNLYGPRATLERYAAQIIPSDVRLAQANAEIYKRLLEEERLAKEAGTPELRQQLRRRGERAAVGLAKTLGISNKTVRNTLSTKRAAGEFAKASLAPAANQFSKNILAQRLWRMYENLAKDLDAAAKQRWFGAHQSVDSQTGQLTIRTMAGQLIKAESNMVGGVAKPLGKLKTPQIRELMESVENGNLASTDPEVRKVFDEIDHILFEENAFLKQHVKASMGILPRHMQLEAVRESLQYVGSYRVPFFHDGKVIGYAYGHTSNQANTMADGIIKELDRLTNGQAHGIHADAGGGGRPRAKSASRLEDMFNSGKIVYGAPEHALFKQARRTVINTDPRLGDSIVPRPADVLDRGFALSSLLRREAGRQSFYDLNLNRLLDVSQSDQALSAQLSWRMGRVDGHETEFSRQTNKFADTLLAPIFGDKSATKIAGAVNGLTHTMALGMLNLSHAALTSLSVLHTQAPYLSALMNAPELMTRYHTAFPNVTPNGSIGGMVGVMSPYKFVFGGLRHMFKPSSQRAADLNLSPAEVFSRAMGDGSISPQFIEEAVGHSALARSMTDHTGNGDFLKAAASLANFTSSKAEMFTRTHAMMTGYEFVSKFLAPNYKRKFGAEMTTEQGYRLIREIADNTMYQYAMKDRPTLFTSPMGSVFGLFKNWMMNYMAQTMLYADMAVNGTAKLGMKRWAPLLHMQAMTAVTAGGAGLPLYAAVNWAHEMLQDEDLITTLYSEMDGVFDNELDTRIPDVIAYGMPAMVGISLQASASAPFSDPSRDFVNLASFVQMRNVDYIMRAIETGKDSIEAGQTPMDDQLFNAQLARALGPKFVYRAMQSAQEDAITSLTNGAPLVGGVSGFEKLAFILGLNPVDIDKAYEVNQMLYRDRTRSRQAVAAFGRAYAEAQLGFDTDRQAEILRMALINGVPAESLMRSATQRIKNMQSDIVTRGYKPESYEQYQPIVGDFMVPK